MIRRSWLSIAAALLGSACASEPSLTNACGGASCQAKPMGGADTLALPQLDIEITPPLDSRFVTTQMLNVQLGPAPRLALQLADPIAIQADIVDVHGTLVDSKLTLIADQRIPGRDTTSGSDYRASVAKSKSFRLLPGQYDVIISPVDERPGLEARWLVRDVGQPIDKQFTITPYRRLYGVVASSLSNVATVAGVTVQAFSTSSGLASTATITGAGGDYSIDLPDTEDDSFLLVAYPPADQGPAWGYEEIVNVGDPMGRDKKIPLEPTSRDIVGKARIRIGGMGNGFVPVPGAAVTLTASRAAGLDTRTFSVHGTTDTDGYVVIRDANGIRELALLKSLYTVDIEPPLNSPFSRTVTMLDLTKLGPTYTADEEILLQLRIPAGGKIVSDLGRPVALASLELRPFGGIGRSVTAQTDMMGDFEAELEPGAYLLIVSPRAATDTNEFPPVAVSKIEIPEDAKRFVLPPVTLPKGALVNGSVTGLKDGMPSPNTKVEFFLEVGGEVVSLGATTSDAAGLFQLVLPATMQIE